MISVGIGGGYCRGGGFCRASKGEIISSCSSGESSAWKIEIKHNR